MWPVAAAPGRNRGPAPALRRAHSAWAVAVAVAPPPRQGPRPLALCPLPLAGFVGAPRAPAPRGPWPRALLLPVQGGKSVYSQALGVANPRAGGRGCGRAPHGGVRGASGALYAPLSGGPLRANNTALIRAVAVPARRGPRPPASTASAPLGRGCPARRRRGAGGPGGPPAASLSLQQPPPRKQEAGGGPAARGLAPASRGAHSEYVGPGRGGPPMYWGPPPLGPAGAPQGCACLPALGPRGLGALGPWGLGAVGPWPRALLLLV